MSYRYADKNLQRCMDLSADLLRAAHDQSKPIDRDLAVGVAECVAYLLSRIAAEQSLSEKERYGGGRREGKTMRVREAVKEAIEQGKNVILPHAPPVASNDGDAQ